MSGVLSNHCPSYSFEPESFTEPGIKLATSKLQRFCFNSTVLELQTWLTNGGFLMVGWELRPSFLHSKALLPLEPFLHTPQKRTVFNLGQQTHWEGSRT